MLSPVSIHARHTQSGRGGLDKERAQLLIWAQNAILIMERKPLPGLQRGLESLLIPFDFAALGLEEMRKAKGSTCTLYTLYLFLS